jgi:hypothetical protein
MPYIFAPFQLPSLAKYPIVSLEAASGVDPISGDRLLCGTRLTIEEIARFPKYAHIAAVAHSPPRDFLEFRENCLIVSRCARDVIESIEPQTHQFFELEFSRKVDFYWRAAEYSIVNICQKQNIINVKKSTLKKQIIEAYKDMLPQSIHYHMPSSGEVKIVTCLTEDMKYHLWRGDERVLEHKAFISDELKNAWEQSGLGPLGLIECVTS